eukprot:4508456-Amphidinium_carterae.1
MGDMFRCCQSLIPSNCFRTLRTANPDDESAARTRLLPFSLIRGGVHTHTVVMSVFQASCATSASVECRRREWSFFDERSVVPGSGTWASDKTVSNWRQRVADTCYRC